MSKTLVLVKPDAVERGLVGTIRGDNSIHASDSEWSAKREISLWFPEGF